MHQVHVTLKGIEKVWEQPVSSHLCSPLIANKRIYIAGPELFCLDFKTGETIWKGAGFNYGGFCVLTQDDRLVVLGNRGKLRLIDTVDHQQTEYGTASSCKLVEDTGDQKATQRLCHKDDAVVWRKFAADLVCGPCTEGAASRCTMKVRYVESHGWDAHA